MSASVQIDLQSDRMARNGISPRSGTHTRQGFIRYLQHPKHGYEMPIIVQRKKGAGSSHLPNAWIEGSRSFWAMPGGEIFVSHDPVAII